jgi:hypothetical protein
LRRLFADEIDRDLRILEEFVLTRGGGAGRSSRPGHGEQRSEGVPRPSPKLPPALIDDDASTLEKLPASLLAEDEQGAGGAVSSDLITLEGGSRRPRRARPAPAAPASVTATAGRTAVLPTARGPTPAMAGTGDDDLDTLDQRRGRGGVRRKVP